ncbi:MAG: peptidylprolyl isomerase [Clostridiaceae bacterium]|nr:peptidylprolyl isomerase [Clostridiaceae bacterium]
MKLSRSIAVILALCMIATLVTGCSSSPAIMKVDGQSVPAGYYIYNYCTGYSSYSSTYSDEELANYAMQEVVTYYIVEKLCKQYGLELTALERKAVLDGITEQITEMGGNSVYKTFLQKMQLSKKQFQNLMYNSYKKQKLEDYLYNAETGVEKPTTEQCYDLFKQYYCCATHILISTQNAESQADYDAAKAKAEEVLAKARAGEDFIALANEYNEDTSQDNSVGMVFPKGYMVAAFEDAAFALEEGAISDIVQTEYGYHIIKRNPITQEMYEQYHDSFLTYAEDYYFQERLGTESAEMNIEILDALYTLDLTDALMYIMGY